MTTKYKILFMVDLLNEYYANLQCRDFQVIASAETSQLFQNHQILFKTIGNKLVVLVKVQTEAGNEDKPVVAMAADAKFLFYLNLNQPLFTTITNLDSDRLRLNQRYYFTNLYQNKAGASLHLSKQVAEYDNAATYDPGDLVDDGSGTVYECIQHTTGGNDTVETDFWFRRGTEQYVSSGDMMHCIGNVNRFKTTVPATKFTIQVFGLNTATNQYTWPVTITKSTVTSDVATNEVQVDLSELSPGRYSVQINGEVFDVFVDDAVIYRNLFGVIEIFSHLPATSDFSLLDNNGKVKDTLVGGNLQWLRYQVRFANRLAFWKYVTPRKGVKAIKDKTNTYQFVQSPPLPAVPDYFQSHLPIPIKETPVVYDLELNTPVSDEPPPAPNPDPNVTGMLSRKEPGKDYYCTIYLNY
ncbi:MAG TPA: hypothetical protein VF008_05030 [Niastella sp.]